MTILARANMALEALAEARRIEEAAHAAITRALIDATPSERATIREWLDKMERPHVE